tara:strand:- start:69 stop:404 length:336 start_codon:yes stop_codon:yes gene_type:complete
MVTSLVPFVGMSGVQCQEMTKSKINAYVKRMEKWMTTSYSKIRGRSKGHRYRNSIVDLQRDLQRANTKKTPQELGEHERFEDDPRALKEIEYGRVVRKSTSGIDDRRRGDY